MLLILSYHKYETITKFFAYQNHKYLENEEYFYFYIND